MRRDPAPVPARWRHTPARHGAVSFGRVTRFRAAPCTRQGHAGQAIVFILAMLPILFLSILVVYNAAVATREKMKLQATADATTYSTSVVVARNLNYLAYTNRAMAANEASVALMASLQTSTGMLISSAANVKEIQAVTEGYKGALNLARASRPVIGIIYFFRYLRNLAAADRAARAAERIAGYVEPAAKPFQWAADVIRVLNRGISLSQPVMMAATVADIPMVAKDVMNANDPDAGVPVAETALLSTKYAADVFSFLKTYDQAANGGSEEDFNEVLRFGFAAQATRDDFTKNRRIFPDLFKDWLTHSGNLAGGSITDLVSAGTGDGAGELAAFTGQDVDNSDAQSQLAGALAGGLMKWRGGTELVATRGIGRSERGRIRWQSGDNLDVNLPLGPLATNIFSDWGDTGDMRFGLAAAAAAAGGPYTRPSWEGFRLALPTFYNTDARTYGDITDGNGVLNSDSFEHAAMNTRSGWLFAGLPVLQFDLHFRYGPRTEIGTITREWTMPTFSEMREHQPLKAHEMDNWLAQNGFSGKNPLKWGAKTDNGPTFTLVVQKDGNKTRTGEVAGFGDPGADSRAGLKDRFAGDKVKAISSAQVYFKRPQDRWARRDQSKDDIPKVGRFNVGFTGGYIEHRSLFSPYWQVRNVEPSLWARGLAMGVALVGDTGDEDSE